MNDLTTRIARVEAARGRVLEFLDGIDEPRSAFKPDDDRWSIQEIAEHLALAEEVGILFVWRATNTEWNDEHPHRGQPIERVVETTWQEKEIAPEPARPRFGGPLAYWRLRLEGCGSMLARLGKELEGRDLETIIYPHALSGPLDAGQRIDFLAFHMDRHLKQMQSIPGP